MLTREWKCFGGLGCLEARQDGNSVLLRETSNPDVVVSMTISAWESFVFSIKAGDGDIS